MDENDLKKVVFVLLEDNFQQDAACQHGGKTYIFRAAYVDSSRWLEIMSTAMI